MPAPSQPASLCDLEHYPVPDVQKHLRCGDVRRILERCGSPHPARPRTSGPLPGACSKSRRGSRKVRPGKARGIETVGCRWRARREASRVVWPLVEAGTRRWRWRRVASGPPLPPPPQERSIAAAATGRISRTSRRARMPHSPWRSADTAVSTRSTLQSCIVLSKTEADPPRTRWFVAEWRQWYRSHAVAACQFHAKFGIRQVRVQPSSRPAENRCRRPW